MASEERGTSLPTPIPSPTQNKRSGNLRSVRNALAALEAFDSEHHELGVTQIAERLGLPVSTAHRLLGVLADCGYLEATKGRTYRLGVKVLEIGTHMLDHRGFSGIAFPYVKGLADLTNETVNMAVLDGDEIVYVVVVPTKEVLRPYFAVGRRHQALKTALGKAVFAFSVDPAGWPGHMWGELNTVKRQGVAYDREESDKGVLCVAVPVLDKEKRAIAALSVSGPTSRLTEDRIQSFLPSLKETGQALSACLVRHATLIPAWERMDRE